MIPVVVGIDGSIISGVHLGPIRLRIILRYKSIPFAVWTFAEVADLFNDGLNITEEEWMLLSVIWPEEYIMIKNKWEDIRKERIPY